MKITMGKWSKRNISKKIIYALLLLLVVYSFKAPRIDEHIKIISSTDSTMSPLAMYGESIYKAENCGSCHSLVSTDSTDEISLDGMGGKYPDSWHFYHLQDPASVVPNSHMPRFDYLSINILSKEFFRQVVTEKFGNTAPNDFDLLWQKLNVEADTMLHQLRAQKVPTVINSEALALIAYLQQIPSSPEKAKRDKMISAQFADHSQEWNSSMFDSNSMMLRIAQSKNADTIHNGQILYRTFCTPCHGEAGRGLDGLGPNLTDEYWLHGGTTVAIAQTIVNGVPDKGMKSWKYDMTPTQIGELVAYISSLKGTNPKNAKEKQGVKE